MYTNKICLVDVLYGLYCYKLEGACSRTTEVQIKYVWWICCIAYIVTNWKVPVRIPQRSE